MFTLEREAASAILAENIYHIAHLVPDLVAAMAAFSQSLGIGWAEPFEMVSQFHTPDGCIDDSHLRIGYSLQGPPFIELIERVAGSADSPFAKPPGGVHHLGVYAERWRDETARLIALGFVHELSGDGLAFVRDPVLDIRYEIVSFRGRAFLTSILNGEVGRRLPLRARGA
ncbi:MAG: VOC family protein [Sphingomonadaceae bacterium]|nr:VOC family protein [Sphingomonadaceae bacterium]